MSALEILDDLFFIERGFLNANHFVCRADAPALIDTAYMTGLAETIQSIEEVGVDPRSVSLIVNTHCHCDHIGANKTIQEISGCDIAMHVIGKHFIDSRDAWSTWWRYFGQEADFFDCGQALRDGDILRLGPHEFKVIYTPGHAADGIVLYHEQAKILISSDTLWERDMAVMNIRVEGSATLFRMMESLDRIAALDVKAVYPGHGRPFTDMAAAIEQSRKRLRGFLEDRRRIGNDLIKKIVVYTLMMKERLPEETFFGRLMSTPWYPETVDLYFDGAYQSKYDAIMKDFLSRGIVKREDGMLLTTVKP